MGLCKSNPVVTHSLQAPGFINLCTLNVIPWFQSLRFQMQLVPLHPGGKAGGPKPSAAVLKMQESLRLREEADAAAAAEEAERAAAEAAEEAAEVGAVYKLNPAGP